MAEYHSMEEIRTLKEIQDAIEKINKINQQLYCPDRQGMISALQEAKAKAPLALTVVELIQGDNRWMPFDSFSDADLYRKLEQYKLGLEAYCVEKAGKELYDKLKNK